MRQEEGEQVEETVNLFLQLFRKEETTTQLMQQG